MVHVVIMMVFSKVFVGGGSWGSLLCWLVKVDVVMMVVVMVEAAVEVVLFMMTVVVVEMSVVIMVVVMLQLVFMRHCSLML